MSQSSSRSPQRPILSDAGLQATREVQARDEQGLPRWQSIAAERPLTLYLDKREIVTLMTLGTRPEQLVLGYLRNQRLVARVEDIARVTVDWEVDAVAVSTHAGNAGDDPRLDRRTVTTGCGQGTVFGDLMDDIEQIQLPAAALRQSGIYALLARLREENEVYRSAGAVHGCALCRVAGDGGAEVLYFCEDVGRHNAVDAIAGQMWLDGVDGGDKVFYTTGRLTSEMVIKVAQMGVPVLLSRSGITEMGLALGERLGVMLIARAKGRHFLVYSGAERLEFDAPPAAVGSGRPPQPRRSRTPGQR